MHLIRNQQRMVEYGTRRSQRLIRLLAVLDSSILSSFADVSPKGGTSAKDRSLLLISFGYIK